jgi:hypothetical protein
MRFKRLAISSTKGTQSKRRLGVELKRRCTKCKVRALAKERRGAARRKVSGAAVVSPLFLS